MPLQNIRRSVAGVSHPAPFPILRVQCFSVSPLKYSFHSAVFERDTGCCLVRVIPHLRRRSNCGMIGKGNRKSARETLTRATSYKMNLA